ncbi:MAG: 50S ribosomal protein L11 methyltransferase [Candidatus Moranbacteria bacterium]|nr:50S ribosomal protein L11 methyltransferase [Candidatus Moranbacteria bacterium]
MEGTKEYWSMTEGVFNCLIDKERTHAFKAAIQHAVKVGDVVVDMGTGSGVLAMFAADCGAKKVFAVESDEKNYKTLERTFEINGYQDVISLIRGDIRSVKLPEKVDVIIGEMIATGLIEELQVPAMNNMLRFAKNSVVVVLNRFRSYVDLVSNPDEYYGHRFKILRYEYPEIPEIKSVVYSEKELFSDVDFSQIVEDLDVNKELTLTVTKNGSINAIRISSETIFSDKSVFSASFAYSYPIILPIETHAVSIGDRFRINISYKLCQGFDGFGYACIKI